MHQHDSARPRVMNTVTQFLISKTVYRLPSLQPRCSTLWLFLFPTPKRQLRGQHFQTTDSAAKAAEVILKMSKNGFKHVFDDWQKCWDKCTEFRGALQQRRYILKNSLYWTALILTSCWYFPLYIHINKAYSVKLMCFTFIFYRILSIT